MMFEEVQGDHQLQNCVTEEFHPFVVFGSGVLGHVRPVHQRRPQEVAVLKGGTQMPFEIGQVDHYTTRSASRCTRPRSAPSAARAIALAIATDDDVPWAMTTTPFDPTRCAPPNVS